MTPQLQAASPRRHRLHGAGGRQHLGSIHSDLARLARGDEPRPSTPATRFRRAPLVITTATAELAIAPTPPISGVYRPGRNVRLESATRQRHGSRDSGAVFAPFFTPRSAAAARAWASVCSASSQCGGPHLGRQQAVRGTVFRVYLLAWPRVGTPRWRSGDRDAVLQRDRCCSQDDRHVRDVAPLSARHGYRLLASSDGHEAVRSCRRSRTDHLLLTEW